jgi:predicted metalloendopeptidase
MPSYRFGLDCDCCEPGNFDITAGSKKNFYNFTNGGWKSTNAIPKEYSSWNNFMMLRDGNLDKLKEIVSELEEKAATTGTAGAATGTAAETDEQREERKVMDFYASMMDEAAIEARGVVPLRPLLQVCLAANADPTAALATLTADYGVRALFSIGSRWCDYMCYDIYTCDNGDGVAVWPGVVGGTAWGEDIS